GQLTPVSVRPAEDGGYVLIAGHKRCAALASLGQTEVRAELRADDSQEESERAAENIVRSALNPYEEALAVRAMLDRGLTAEGAAQALGWPKARVTARVKLLELPELAQQMVGDGRLALSSVEQLRAIGAVSPELLDALIAFMADGNEWAAERLTREPGWVLDSALRAGKSKAFAEHLGGRVDSHDIASLKLGKKAEAAYERAGELTRALDRYAYHVDVRFDDSEIDQARAAGVVIEFERSAPIIVDRPLYRELVKAAITRTVTELDAKVAAREQERKTARQTKKNASAPANPAADAEREHRQQMRQISDQAHGVNLDVGAELLKGLSTVDPADVTVARFFVYSLLGSDYDDSPYTQQGERIARLAVSGIRLVIGEFRADVTKTRKDGSKGALRIDYGNAREPKEPVKWLWKYVDGAKTAGELYGRALVVIAAEQYATRLVVPQSQRTPAIRWSSHKDLAAKALSKLAGPHLPASLRQLETAIKRAKEEHDRAVKRARAAAQRASRADAAAEDTAAAAAQEGAADAETAVDVDEVEVEEGDEAEQ
ncbi:MAG TPA: ParB N-terminal domain-containing protein, partial [Solirubrobacteraceae bacterium]|nr:ParB N-terminal domain-containing protein [Solirubrobacteraceae bacterium]